MHPRALAAIQEGARAVMVGALAPLRFAAVALQARLGVGGAPGPDGVALTAGPLAGLLVPAPCLYGDWTRVGGAEGGRGDTIAMAACLLGSRVRCSIGSAMLS